MRARAGLIALLLPAGLAPSTCAAAKPPPSLHCRHPLAMAASADDLPGPVLTQLRPWMALHGERWNKTDSINPGEKVASFLWAAQWNGDWIVAFTAGGDNCCHNRLALLKPVGAAYRQVPPSLKGPDLFGDITCKGIDAALDAQGAHG